MKAHASTVILCITADPLCAWMAQGQTLAIAESFYAGGLHQGLARPLYRITCQLKVDQYDESGAPSCALH